MPRTCQPPRGAASSSHADQESGVRREPVPRHRVYGLSCVAVSVIVAGLPSDRSTSSQLGVSVPSGSARVRAAPSGPDPGGSARGTNTQYGPGASASVAAPSASVTAVAAGALLLVPGVIAQT